MDEALELARHGVGRTSPNPAVGAVLVNGGEIVGRGFHTYARVKHAEILALEEAGDRARGATLYVTLEPCSHHGRTPPCVRRIGSGRRRASGRCHGRSEPAGVRAGIRSLARRRYRGRSGF